MRRPAREKTEDVSFLCRKMVERCDEYLALKNTPERELKAAEVKRDILRLYAEISVRGRK